MAKYFNTSGQAHSVTFANKKVVRFPAKSWSETIPRDDEGNSQLLRLIRKGVLRRDPLAVRTVLVETPAAPQAPAAPVEEVLLTPDSSEETASPEAAEVEGQLDLSDEDEN